MREQHNGNGSYPGGRSDRKMRGAVNGNGNGNGHHLDVHPARRMMVDYLTGACSSEEREIVEDHCLDCDACRAQLAALVHLVVSSAHERENQRRQVEALLPLGEQAAARARSIVRRQEGWDRQKVSHWANWWNGLQVFRPILAPALVVVALLGGGLIAYLSMWRQTPEDLTLARIREVYHDARFLQ